MQRVSAVLGSALFFLVAPCVLAGLIPWSMTRWEFRPAFFGLEGARSVGVLLILVGLPGLVDSFARFALQGLGTPAPVAPTKNLVVTGLYRYVRNPIYVAVVAIILGQAVLMGDWRLIVYGALLWLFFHVFVVAYEEPTLERTFGREYEAFRAAVPRWIPRMTPWRSKCSVARGCASRCSRPVSYASPAPRPGTLTALGKEHLPIGEAVGFQAHRNALRQTRSELLLSPVPRCRRGILAL